jgi:phosphoserine aminotransferase
MISFYPGPSRVHDEIPKYVKKALEEGILSMNHRSDDFMHLSEKVIRLLKNRLHIPDDYTIFYTTSATECWEIIAQSLISKNSFHLYNGAFGKKWFEYTRRICSEAKHFPFDQDEIPNHKKLRIGKEQGVICLTQNETSNGTQVSNEILLSVRERYPDQLIAVDATSSMAGIFLDFKTADVWFASVQKCFGLPAGLGLMICSPAAIQKVKEIGDKKYYNSLSFMAEMMQKWQTPFTPNVLNIYLLMRVLEKSKPIEEVHTKIKQRYLQWIDFLKDRQSLQHLIRNEEVRSYTVIPVLSKEALVSAIKSRARKKNILLGEGYGDLKASTFRIANFPAIKKNEINLLKDFLDVYR